MGSKANNFIIQKVKYKGFTTKKNNNKYEKFYITEKADTLETTQNPIQIIISAIF